MSINGYEYTSLSEKELKKISSLEKELNKKGEKEIILLAFDREN